jgi:hypothetical protein
MAANKWTKWFVGLSSTALFTFIIGMNASHSSQSSQLPAKSSSNVDSSNLSNQWMNQDQSSSDGSTDDSSEPQDSGVQMDSSQGPQSRESGGMRTQAS